MTSKGVIAGNTPRGEGLISKNGFNAYSILVNPLPRMVAGPGAVSTVGKEVLALGRKYAMIVTDLGLTKAGLINLAESLFFDLKKEKIKISLINPGFIESELTKLNSFPMPFLKSADYAAEKIYKGLTGKYKFEIFFPWFFIILLKIFRILPYKLYFFLISKFTKL